MRESTSLVIDNKTVSYGLTLKQGDRLRFTIDFTDEDGGTVHISLLTNGVFRDFGIVDKLLDVNTVYYPAFSLYHEGHRIEIENYHETLPLDQFSIPPITQPLITYSKHRLMASSIQQPNSNVWRTVYGRQKIVDNIDYQWKIRVVDLPPQTTSLVIGVIRDNEFKNIFNILTNNDLGYGLDNLGRLVSATSTDDYMMPYKTGDIITIEVIKVKDSSLLRFYKNGLVSTSGIENFGRLDTVITYDWRLAVSFKGPGTVEIEDWDVLYPNQLMLEDDWDRDIKKSRQY